MRRTAEEWQAAAERIRTEGALSVSKAARLVPTDSGEPASPSTLVRWIVKGKRGVRLDGARFTGKTWWTSAKALERFWAGLAAKEAGRAEDASSDGRAGETLIQRESRAEAASRELRRVVGL